MMSGTEKDMDIQNGMPSADEAMDSSAQHKVDPYKLHDPIVAAIKTVFDPEIPVDIYELGLIYKLDIDEAGQVEVEMTVTAPGCPVAADMPGWVQDAVRTVDGVRGVNVRMTFDPPWDPSRMSDEARVALDMF